MVYFFCLIEQKFLICFQPTEVVPVVSTEASPTIIIPVPRKIGPQGVGPPDTSLPPDRDRTQNHRIFTSIPHVPELRTIASPSDNCIECNHPLVQRYHLS